MTIDIRTQDLTGVKDILKRSLPANTTIWVFGSRAKRTAKKFSDLDLAINTGKPLPLKTLAILSSEFEDSDLPYKVDVVDLLSVSPSFRALIEETKVFLCSLE